MFTFCRFSAVAGDIGCVVSGVIAVNHRATHLLAAYKLKHETEIRIMWTRVAGKNKKMFHTAIWSMLEDTIRYCPNHFT
jgi:hypothetical protein